MKEFKKVIGVLVHIIGAILFLFLLPVYPEIFIYNSAGLIIGILLPLASGIILLIGLALFNRLKTDVERDIDDLINIPPSLLVLAGIEDVIFIFPLLFLSGWPLIIGLTISMYIFGELHQSKSDPVFSILKGTYVLFMFMFTQQYGLLTTMICHGLFDLSLWIIIFPFAVWINPIREQFKQWCEDNNINIETKSLRKQAWKQFRKRDKYEDNEEADQQDIIINASLSEAKRFNKWAQDNNYDIKYNNSKSIWELFKKENNL